MNTYVDDHEFMKAVGNYINNVNKVMKKNSEGLPYVKLVIATFGRNYVKVMLSRYDANTLEMSDNSSAYAFIVKNTNDKKFIQGAILKPASAKGPTRNFARGTVFDVDSYAPISPYGI